jgi:hypothetical protein
MKLDKETYEKIIHSKEFKDWFGDWEHPNKKTSKIVDKNGKPLVVYHGSPYKFTEFKYGMNDTSGQMGAEYAFWFSNLNVATHYSQCYPRSYYNERNEVNEKYNEKIEKDKIEFLKTVDMSVWDGMLSFIEKEYGKSTGYYNLSSWVKSDNWKEVSKTLMDLLFWIGKKNIDEISPKLSEFVHLDKKYDIELNKELEEIQSKYDNQEGYIYPCFIKATIIEEEDGENVGVGLNRVPDSSIHCKIIRNADTGAQFADEYVVTNPKRIKIATGENTTFNGKRMIINFGEFEFVLLEKNNESIDGQTMYNKLIKRFPEINIDRPEGISGESITIWGIYKGHDKYEDIYKWYEDLDDKEFIDKLLKYINKFGWYSRASMTRIKNTHTLSISPKWSKGYVLIPDTLYHACPMSRLNDILKHGLKSKSEDIRHKYPPRIYMSTNKEVLYSLIKELKVWKQIDKTDKEPYAIVGINTDDLNLGILYKDQMSLFTGNCYIQGKSIPAKYLWVVDKNI